MLMKTFFRNVMAGVVLLSAAFAAVSCQKGEETTPAPDAKVTIELDEPTATSVSFTLNYENAKSLAYACVEAANVEGVELQEVALEEAEGSYPVSIDDLAAETEYVIVAEATNADDVKSARVTETFTTLKADEPLPAAQAKVEIGEITADITSATVEVTITDADAFFYAVVAGAGEPTEYLSDVEATATSVELTELTANTEYTFWAYASKDGVAGDFASKTFITLEEEGGEGEAIVLDGKGGIDVELAAATATSLEFNVTMVDFPDTTVAAYYIFSDKDEYTEETILTAFADDTLYEEIDLVGTVTFRDLTPETAYDVWFVALDVDGKYSDLVKMSETTAAEEEDAPLATLGEVTDKSVEIILADGEYYVMIFSDGTFANDEEAEAELRDGWTYSKYASGSCKFTQEKSNKPLEPETHYNIWVVALDNMGVATGETFKLEATTTEAVEVETPEVPEGEIAVLTASTSDSATVYYEYESSNYTGWTFGAYPAAEFGDPEALANDLLNDWNAPWIDGVYSGTYEFTGLTAGTAYKLLIVVDEGGDYVADAWTVIDFTPVAE